MAEHEVQVIRVIEESPLDRTYVLELNDARPFPWVAGQYTWITDPAAEEPKPRAYSISSAPRDDGRFELTIRAGSPEDVQRFGYAEGQALVATTPEGGFTPKLLAGRRLLLCGAGSGVTPFRAAVQQAGSLDDPPEIVFVHSDRAPSTLLFREELEAAADARPWFTYAPRVTRKGHGEHWDGPAGRITRDELAALVADPGATWVYACGPGAFVDHVLAAVQSLGIAEERCHREGWG